MPRPRKLSQYSRAADAPVRVNQYSETSSRMRSRDTASSGLVPESENSKNFSAIQAGWAVGESTSAYPIVCGRVDWSQLYPLLRRINTYLMRWARKKYKRLRSYKRFRTWWTGLVQRAPGLFKHWAWDREFVWAR